MFKKNLQKVRSFDIINISIRFSLKTFTKNLKFTILEELYHFLFTINHKLKNTY